MIRGGIPETPPVLEDWERPLYDFVACSPALPLAPPCPVDRELSDGDTLDWGEEVRIIHVPGHTAGSIACHLPDSGVLFTGDTVANVGQLMLGGCSTWTGSRRRPRSASRRLSTSRRPVSDTGIR
ncbi:hypothetical protein GCM10020000_60860 [Streptomyces olivoverticillatus]